MKKATGFFKKLYVLLGISLLFFSFSAKAQVFIRDAETEKYLQSITQPIFKAAGLIEKQTSITLLMDRQVNAFVANGQSLYLYTGLILRAENEDELKGVIAHETGHMMGAHLSRLRKQVKYASYQAMIGMALGAAALAMSKNDGMAEVGTTLLVGSQDIAIRNLMAYSRGEEEMADESAITLLNKLNMPSTGLLTFMDKLKKDQMLMPDMSPYLLSHPMIDERIKHLNVKIAQQKKYPASKNDNFFRIRYKLQGYILSEYEYNKLKIDSWNWKYGKIVNLMKYSKLDEAVKLANSLLETKKNDPYIFELLGEIYFFQNKFNDAEKYYQKAYDITNSPLILTDLARVQTELKKYDEAISNLKIAVYKDKSIGNAYKQLSICYGKKDNKPVSNYYLAEYYFRIGDMENTDIALTKAMKTLDKESPEYLKATDLKLEYKNKLKEK